MEGVAPLFRREERKYNKSLKDKRKGRDLVGVSSLFKRAVEEEFKYYYDIDDIDECDDIDDIDECDDIDDIDECDEEVDGLRRIVNECNLSALYDVADKDLEDELRDRLRMSTVVRIRSIVKKLGIRKVSGLRKHKLIDAVISWGYKQSGMEGELRRMCPSKLIDFGNAFGVRVYIPVDKDKAVKEIIEAIVAHNLRMMEISPWG